MRSAFEVAFSWVHATFHYPNRLTWQVMNIRAESISFLVTIHVALLPTREFIHKPI